MLSAKDDEDDGLGDLHEIVPRDHKLIDEWQQEHARYARGHSDREPASTFELPNASEEYSEYMSELTKYSPPWSHWYNWYSDTQTISYRRWSIFDVALGYWVSGFVESLKQQLEAARICEHTVVDPTPHYRFLRMSHTRDILRPNLGLNQEGLGKYQEVVAQDARVPLPVVVFQVATRETLKATRSDIWRHLWLSERCQVGIIFIVNSFYDQYVKPFKLSVEIWNQDPKDLEYPYRLDDCPLPTSHIPPGCSGKKQVRSVQDLAGCFKSVDKHVLGKNADGFPTFTPSEDLTEIVMRHKEEIVVIDETREGIDLLKHITLRATDFIPFCRARLDQDVTVKPITISLDSLRESVRREWDLCRASEEPPEKGYDMTMRWSRLYRPQRHAIMYSEAHS